jgi:hypothetical protein
VLVLVLACAVSGGEVCVVDDGWGLLLPHRYNASCAGNTATHTIIHTTFHAAIPTDAATDIATAGHYRAPSRAAVTAAYSTAPTLAQVLSPQILVAADTGFTSVLMRPVVHVGACVVPV